MNVTGHRAYTVISNQNKPQVQKNTAPRKPLLSLPFAPANTQSKSALEETPQDVETRLAKKFPLVRDESIKIDERVLESVANDEKSSFELERVLSSVSQSFTDEKNHATASGENLTHFSSKITEWNNDQSHSFQVETWWKRDDGKGNVNHVKPQTIDDFLLKKHQNKLTKPSITEEKIQAKDRFVHQDVDQRSHLMQYNVKITEPFFPSSYSRVT